MLPNKQPRYLLIRKLTSGFCLSQSYLICIFRNVLVRDKHEHAILAIVRFCSILCFD
jgi:hypothetical protein